MLVLRGDHTLNALKAEKLEQVAVPLTFADESEIRTMIGCGPGSIGPVGLTCPVVVDRAASAISNFVCGANQDDVHWINANWGRDILESPVADLRNIESGDPAPTGEGVIEIKRGIEVGHIFQLGNKYSASMKASVLDAEGKALTMVMGCYGIGVSRLVGAAIEQNNDERGIIWPDAIAPFQVILIPINAHKSPAVQDAADLLYQRLSEDGFEVLIDDRHQMRPGAKFADAELIGIPHRIVIGERALANDEIEYTCRSSGETTLWSIGDVTAQLRSALDL